MTDKPFVFIGSSTEGLKYAEAIQANLEYNCETQIWHQGLFGLSDGTLESLIKSLTKFDFAILVLTGDDLTISLEQETKSPRDNVIFELGLFIGGLGRERVFIVVDRDTKPKLPTDLAGITPATFSPPNKGTHQSSVGTACTQIKEKVAELGVREIKPVQETTDKYENDLIIITTYLQSKNLSRISLKGLTEFVDRRFTSEYISKIIEANPKRITRSKLKGDISGIKILDEVNVSINDNIPTEIKDSIDKYKNGLLTPTELERVVTSLMSANYGFQKVENITKQTSVGPKRIKEVLDHLVEHGFAERKVGYDGVDFWRMLKIPIRIYSATYQWPTGQVDVTERINELVELGVYEAVVDPGNFGIGDPIYGTIKTLHLHYRIHGQEKYFAFKDGETFKIK